MWTANLGTRMKLVQKWLGDVEASGSLVVRRQNIQCSTARKQNQFNEDE